MSILNFQDEPMNILHQSRIMSTLVLHILNKLHEIETSILTKYLHFSMTVTLDEKLSLYASISNIQFFLSKTFF